MEPLVRVENLRVTASAADGREIVLVDEVGFQVPRGEVLALIGESGSGKSTIALALLGYARRGCRIAGGSVRVAGSELTTLTSAELFAFRGRHVSYVAQSAAAAFNPSRTLMNQVIEPALLHGLLTRAAAQARAVELFRALALPDPERIGARYPHQVSGGQLQRVMAAMALITEPALVVFDEPTTALDVTTQLEVLHAFKTAIRDRATTAVYVSHDLAVVAQMADRVVVLQHGRIREAGPTAEVLYAPKDEYARTLLAAVRAPERAGAATASDGASLLEVRGLSAGYGRLDKQGNPAKPILYGVDFAIARGAALGVIGESGSGKSTLARVIAGLLPQARGEVRLAGELLPARLADRTREQCRRVQLVVQNADTALNPAHSIGQILERPLAFYHGMKGPERKARVAELLERVHLPKAMAGRAASELSGGQKQRINLARALAAEPELLLCDEVTSALDTVVGAAILDLIAELRRELGVAVMFISHDITTVRSLCDRIVVLYGGTVVEAGARSGFRAPPFHPYTDLLVRSVPELRGGWLEQTPVASVAPLTAPSVPGLCRFLDRCALRIEGVCDREPPPQHTLADGNLILCHHGQADLVRLQDVHANRTELAQA